MLKQLTITALAGLTALTLAGCPNLNPPFDASGNYEGTFSLGLEDTILVENCGIALELEHDADALPFENTKVSGTVALDLTCVVDGGAGKSTIQDLLDSLLGELLASGPVEVSGFIGPNGTIELSTADLLTECPEANCEKLLLIGSGRDTNDDGEMDTYEGIFGGLVEISGQVVPLGGEFTADAADED